VTCQTFVDHLRLRKGDRVFQYAKGELSADDDALTTKLKRIREITKDGFEVGQVIHRHWMSEDEELEVEAR
jgi:hypothetical protein